MAGLSVPIKVAWSAPKFKNQFDDDETEKSVLKKAVELLEEAPTPEALDKAPTPFL